MMRLSKFVSLLRVRDLGYLFSAIVGGLLVAALPGGVVALCPTASTGSVADNISAAFAGTTFVATVLIAVVAHQLNKTLKSSEERKSVVAARMYCKVADAQIKHVGAKCGVVANRLKRWINGEDSVEGLEGVSLEVLHSYLYQNEIIGHLPDATAQGLAKFFADYVGVYDTLTFVLKGVPHALPSNFMEVDPRVQEAFRNLASDLEVCCQGATASCVDLAWYLKRTAHIV